MDVLEEEEEEERKRMDSDDVCYSEMWQSTLEST